MAIKDLFRRLEIEAEKPLLKNPISAMLPRPEAWPSLLAEEDESAYEVTGEDMDGLELGGSVSLDEVLDEEGPAPSARPPRKAATARAPVKEEADEDAVTEDDLEEMGLGGSVSLDELLGEDVPTQKAAPRRKKNSEKDEDLASKIQQKSQGKELSLDELLDEFVPDEGK
jgi:hypothetical protein